MKDRLFDYFMDAYNNHFNINSLIEFQDKYKVNVDILIAELIDKKLHKLYNDNLWLEFIDKHNYKEVTKYFQIDDEILNQYHILRLVKRNLPHIRDIVNQFSYLTNSQIAKQLYMTENIIHFWRNTKFNDFINNINKDTCKEIIKQVNDGIDIKDIARNYNISADGIIYIYTNIDNYKENQNRNKILKFIKDTPGYMDIEHLQQHVHLSNKVCIRWGFISIVYNNGGIIPHALISIILDQVDSKSALFNLGIPRTIYDYIMNKYKDEKDNKNDLNILKDHLQALVDQNKENEQKEEEEKKLLKKNDPPLIKDSNDIKEKHANIKKELDAETKHNKDKSIMETLDRVVNPNSDINNPDGNNQDNDIKDQDIDDTSKYKYNVAQYGPKNEVNDSDNIVQNDKSDDNISQEEDLNQDDDSGDIEEDNTIDKDNDFSNIKKAKDNKIYNKREFNPFKLRFYGAIAIIIIVIYIILIMTNVN